jgi:hypothetical protein
LLTVTQTRTRFNRCRVRLANAKRDEEDAEKREVFTAPGKKGLPKRELFGLKDEATNIVVPYSYTIPLHLH